MKTLKHLLFVPACICLLISCEKSDDFLSEDPVNSSSETLKCIPGGNHHRPSMPEPRRITLPFRADFVGNYVGMEPSSLCGEDSWIMITNEGGGTGTFLGNFTHHFEFCCDVVTGIYPGNYMKAYFVAANGDSLFVACAGQVIEGRAEDQPEFVTSYFRDPFVILGGTGRFKGATGKGITDDYNSSLDPNSHHQWRGIITMVKGR
jgi:hypothetical protein